jgi:predicted membrane chloride channel (bestrophin family)
MYLAINGKDYSDIVSSLKVGYEVLVSDESGRNANGDTVIDIVNKKRKVYVTLRHTTAAEMKSFLASVESFVVTVQYLDAKTNTLKSMSAYINTPEPDYYTISDKTIFKPMNINFIEL